MEGYHRGGEEGRMEEKVQGVRSINGRYKIDRGRLGIVWGMEKPKNLYVRPMDMNYGGGMLVKGGGYRAEQYKGEKKMGQL